MKLAIILHVINYKNGSSVVLKNVQLLFGHNNFSPDPLDEKNVIS